MLKGNENDAHDLTDACFRIVLCLITLFAVWKISRLLYFFCFFFRKKCISQDFDFEFNENMRTSWYSNFVKGWTFLFSNHLIFGVFCVYYAVNIKTFFFRHFNFAIDLKLRISRVFFFTLTAKPRILMPRNFHAIK